MATAQTSEGSGDGFEDPPSRSNVAVDSKAEKKLKWQTRLARRLHQFAVDAESAIDRGQDRFNTRFHRGAPAYIAAYRAFADATGVELFGRVLADEPQGGPLEQDTWRQNLLHTFRRFETDEVRGARLRVTFRGISANVVSDEEGYYQVRLDLPDGAPGPLWQEATVELEGGGLRTPQPVVVPQAETQFGVISDIDDTIIESSITHWRTAAKLTFLHNARTRKPLQGVAKLYQAFARGTHRTQTLNPIFYVSSSPWNLYDLLEDFLTLNQIPHGPILLRDIGLDAGKVIKSKGHGHKLDNIRRIMGHYLTLKWVLVGDSGQEDAMLYSTAAKEFPGRVLAIYLRDVDPNLADSQYDAYADRYIKDSSGLGVPFLRVKDSNAIAEHAVGLGLIKAYELDKVATEVEKDEKRPTLDQASDAPAMPPSTPAK